MSTYQQLNYQLYKHSKAVLFYEHYHNQTRINQTSRYIYDNRYGDRIKLSTYVKIDNKVLEASKVQA